MSGATYYDEVAAYYDIEADEFEARVCDNHVRQHMLDAFREVTLKHQPKRMLEIGYGPGVDMFWFAEQPEVEVVHGLDVTPAFHRMVLAKAETMGEGKVKPMLGSAEDALAKMGQEKVDTVFVYFGALNTTTDLDASARAIAGVLKPGGRAVLSVVNRWYLFDVLWNLVMLRLEAAMARLRPVGRVQPHTSPPLRVLFVATRQESLSPHLKRVRREGFAHPPGGIGTNGLKGSLETASLFADRCHTPSVELENTAYTFTNDSGRIEARHQLLRNGQMSRIIALPVVHSDAGKNGCSGLLLGPARSGLTPRLNLHAACFGHAFSKPAGGNAPAEGVNHASGASSTVAHNHDAKASRSTMDIHMRPSPKLHGVRRKASRTTNQGPHPGSTDDGIRDRLAPAMAPHRPRRLGIPDCPPHPAPGPRHTRRRQGAAPPTWRWLEPRKAWPHWPLTFVWPRDGVHDLYPPRDGPHGRDASCRSARSTKADWPRAGHRAPLRPRRRSVCCGPTAATVAPRERAEHVQQSRSRR